MQMRMGSVLLNINENNTFMIAYFFFINKKAFHLRLNYLEAATHHRDNVLLMDGVDVFFLVSILFGILMS